MPLPWIKGVQQTAQLTVFGGPGLLTKAPAWGEALFTQTLDEFNRLAEANRFGVRLFRSKAAPDGKGGGANVQVEVSNGSHTFLDEQGNPQQGTLKMDRIRGITHSIGFGAGASKKIASSFVFVPFNPVIGAGQRGVGKGPKMGLLLHELLHACGLGESDPGHVSSIAAGDIFMTNALVDAGSTADKDKFVFGSGSQPDPAGRFTLNTSTVSLVQSVWLLGQF